MMLWTMIVPAWVMTGAGVDPLGLLIEESEIIYVAGASIERRHPNCI